MLNTIEALQELYVSLGGNIEDVKLLNTIPEMISAISLLDIGGTIDTDTTLSVEGKPADAKSVGDALASIITSNEIDTIINAIN